MYTLLRLPHGTVSLTSSGTTATAHLEYTVEIQARQAQLNQLGEEEQAGRHGTALEERREDQVQSAGQDLLLHVTHTVWVHFHHRAQEGEH